MSYRRRRRWLRRLAVGVAFAAVAAPAAAKVDDVGGAQRRLAAPAAGLPAPVLGEDAVAKAAAGAPLGDATRPDDRSDRFVHSDAASTGSGVLSSGTDWNEGLALGLGAVVLALALGLGIGYLSRPRLAGTH